MAELPDGAPLDVFRGRGAEPPVGWVETTVAPAEGPRSAGDGGAASHGIRIVPVFYVTDRAATAEAGPVNLFSAGRGPLQFGQVEVTIPPGQRRGVVETPTWWKFEFSADPAKHLGLRSVERFPDDAAFVGALAHRFEETGRRAALVFVHGYNVSFDAAVLRTAQIAFDLRFRGAPILYSWPSNGRVLRYTHDENNALWTVPHFETFLRLLLSDPGRRPCTSSRTAWATGW